MQNKKGIYILIIVLFVILASIGISYAYWQLTFNGDKSNDVLSGCFSIEMINQKDEITLGSSFPITDEEGLKLKPFSFTLKNTCTINAHYKINLETLNTSNINTRFIKASLDNTNSKIVSSYVESNVSLKDSKVANTLKSGYLPVGGSVILI